MRYRDDAELILLARAGLFVALAGVLQAAESILFSPAPWLRLGLGNALIFAAIALWGIRPALLIAVGKVLLGSLLAGRLFSHLFLFSLSGTLAATLVMYLAYTLLKRSGFIGVSALGAVAHSLTQLFVASLILMGPAVWSLAPLALTAAVVSGTLTGTAAWYIVGFVEKRGKLRS